MHRIDADGHVSNQFSDGDPGIGQPGTQMDAAWANAVQEEIIAAVVGGGGTPTKGTNNQLWAAILAHVASKFPAMSWSTMTPTANWTAGGSGQQPAYWKDAAGVVHLKGYVTAGAGALSQAFTAQLPAGCRPANGRNFSSMKSNGATFSAASVQVDSFGNVSINVAITTGDIFYLDGVSFVAE